MLIFATSRRIYLRAGSPTDGLAPVVPRDDGRQMPSIIPDAPLGAPQPGLPKLLTGRGDAALSFSRAGRLLSRNLLPSGRYMLPEPGTWPCDEGEGSLRLTDGAINGSQGGLKGHSSCHLEKEVMDGPSPKGEMMFFPPNQGKLVDNPVS